MKHFLDYLFALLLLGCIFIRCSDQQAPTALGDGSNTTLDKVTIVEYTWDYNFDDPPEPPLESCVTGALMQYHGFVKIYAKEKTTPSGNWIATGYVDYDAYDGVTLENLSTEEIWTLQNGQNPWNEIENHNGSYRLHYHWNELYKLGNQNLHIHLEGF